jgi:hypothetical protein
VWYIRDMRTPGSASSAAAWRESGGPPRCQLNPTPSRKEREKDRAPAFVSGESMGQPPTRNVADFEDCGLHAVDPWHGVR